MERWLIEDRNSLCDGQSLEKHIRLSANEQRHLAQTCAQFQMKVPPYYLSLIDGDDPDDPIRRMCIPDPRELRIKRGELEDPIGDTNESLNNQPVMAITHRYPDRVLLYPTPMCGGYCRFCFRKRLAGRREFSLTSAQLDRALDYIRSQPSIHEVILTGGDPLMLGDKKLFGLIEGIRSIEHVWTIRIHSRMPVWNPYRITDELAEGLRAYHPVWIVTHFNHPRELSPLAEERLAALIDRGINVLNQAVLLKGVNDNQETLTELFWKLIRNRVKPYYLHQLDKARGISHFRVGIRKGVNILRELRGTIPGYAIPHYILDIPGGYGKVPLQYHYLNSDGQGNIIVEAPDGQLKMYEDGVEKSPEKLMAVDQVHPIEMYPSEIKTQLDDLQNSNEHETGVEDSRAMKKAG
ncbi:KamA family radical SAM protein [bacterium]|nr:KamA family radical SAM protein [bacterium]